MGRLIGNSFLQGFSVFPTMITDATRHFEHEGRVRHNAMILSITIPADMLYAPLDAPEQLIANDTVSAHFANLSFA